MAAFAAIAANSIEATPYAGQSTPRWGGLRWGPPKAPYKYDAIAKPTPFAKRHAPDYDQRRSHVNYDPYAAGPVDAVANPFAKRQAPEVINNNSLRRSPAG